MSIIEKLIDEICDEYAKYRDERYDLPKYLVLSEEYRQALKMGYPHPEISPKIIKTFIGIPIISLEECIILSTKPRGDVNEE